MNRLHVALAFAIFFAVFYLAAQSTGTFLIYSTDVLFVLVSGAASVFAYRVVKVLGTEGGAELVNLRRKLRPVYVGFFLAVLLWFLGEFIWMVYEVALGIQVPYPSIADVFYLAGYFPVILVILRFMWLFRRMVTKAKLAVASLSGIIIVGLMVIFLLQPLSQSSSDVLTKAFDLAYPGLDAALLAIVSIMLLGFSGTAVGKPLMWIFGSLFVYSIADILFSLGTLAGWYYSGHPIELLWLYGYVGLAIGFGGQRAEFLALLGRKNS